MPHRAEAEEPALVVPVPSVLLVDDRPANLLALEAILADLPIQVVRSTSGIDALRQLLLQDFALVLLDVQMPEMDGFETAARMKSHPRSADIPIIFVTAISREAENVFRGYEQGAVDYVLKPFEPMILRAKVQIFVDLYRKNETIKAQASLLREREIAAVTKRSEQRYRRLAEAMPLILWAAHPDGRVYYSNRAWMSYSDGENPGHVARATSLHADDAPKMLAVWNEASPKLAPFEVEARLQRRPDREDRWHLVRGMPQLDEKGDIESWIVTATDIHTQKLAEAAQERLAAHEHKAREAAESANRAKDEFLANVSHELRTPLNSILGWAQMLGAGMLDEAQAKRAVETVERSARFQSALIEDILDAARVRSGKLRLRAEQVDLGNAALTAVDALGPLAERKKIKVEVTVQPAMPRVVGDPDRLQQIVQNLVANALKFTPESGKVSVAICRDETDYARVEVTDSGIGIAPEFLPHVFERFNQADTSSTRRHQGLGLGLSIVHELVTLHHGTIEAKSVGTGHGATFVVRLPLERRTQSDDFTPLLDALAPSPRTRRSLEGIRVLYVDAHSAGREAFTAFITGRGGDVLTADSVESALALIASKVHVLVSDVGLGVRDGYDLIREVRKNPATSTLPAIAVTAFSKVDDGGRALTAGYQFLLSKPVNPTELVGLIATLGHPATDSR